MVRLEEGTGKLNFQLYALARKLEGEGQYNVAKIARASADSLARSVAYPHELPSEKEKLGAEVRAVAEKLQELGLDEGLVKALKAGADAIAEGRLTMMDETPHPYVCRTCGQVDFAFPTDPCPRCHAAPRTFQRFPPVYWLETMDPFEAVNWLERTPNEVRGLIDGLSEEELAQDVIKGEWGIRELLTHLRDAQGVLDFRVNLLIDQEEPVIESSAVFEWAEEGSEEAALSTEIFDSYYSSRKETLQTLRGIALEDWWRSGQHEEFGRVNIMQQASYFATHELTHLPQIASLRDQLGT